METEELKYGKKHAVAPKGINTFIADDKTTPYGALFAQKRLGYIFEKKGGGWSDGIGVCEHPRPFNPSIGDRLDLEGKALMVVDVKPNGSKSMPDVYCHYL